MSKRETQQKKLDFYEFSEFWNKYIYDVIKEPELIKLWNNNTEWTKKVLSKDLHKALEATFGINNKVWGEWRKFDLSIGTNDFFEDIYGYDLGETFEEIYNDRSANKGILEYPKHQLLLLEHENDFKTALNELIKLTYERAKVKVLITYPENIRHRLALITNTLKILEQSDKFLPETETQYILVLGELIDKTIYWSFYQFTYSGILINSHFFQNIGKYLNIRELKLKDFRKHITWENLITIEFSDNQNSIKWINAVKPSNDNTVIRLDDIIPALDYYECYYVSCIFFNEYIKEKGYVELTTDYDFRRDGMFENYMQPVIITEQRDEHIPITFLDKKSIPTICQKLNTTAEKLFPLNYEIQANLEGNGYKKSGIIEV